MKLTKACYRAAKTKIENIENWTQYTFFRSGYGSELDPDDVKEHPEWVKSCCAYGALMIECKLDDNALAKELEIAADMLFQLPATDVNDNNGHEAILQCFDKAIELAEE